jgi:hypothetical protein
MSVVKQMSQLFMSHHSPIHDSMMGVFRKLGWWLTLSRRRWDSNI